MERHLLGHPLSLTLTAKDLPGLARTVAPRVDSMKMCTSTLRSPRHEGVCPPPPQHVAMNTQVRTARAHTREHTSRNNHTATCMDTKEARGRTRPGLTFAVGEVVGAGHTRVAPQPRHLGPAGALPTAGVTGRVQGAFSRAVAGWGRRDGVGMRRDTTPLRPLLSGHSRAQVGKPWKPGLHSWQVAPA